MDVEVNRDLFAAGPGLIVDQDSDRPMLGFVSRPIEGALPISLDQGLGLCLLTVADAWVRVAEAVSSPTCSGVGFVELKGFLGRPTGCKVHGTRHQNETTARPGMSPPDSR